VFVTLVDVSCGMRENQCMETAYKLNLMELNGGEGGHKQDIMLL